jgi:hypothetical protein
MAICSTEIPHRFAISNGRDSGCHDLERHVRCPHPARERDCAFNMRCLYTLYGAAQTLIPLEEIRPNPSKKLADSTRVTSRFEIGRPCVCFASRHPPRSRSDRQMEIKWVSCSAGGRASSWRLGTGMGLVRERVGYACYGGRDGEVDV